MDYERLLLAGLARAGAPARLSALAGGFGKHMDKARSEIVAAAVHDGWIRRFHHDQRTSEGEELAARIRAFQRSLRRALPELAPDVLDGLLLPYAMRCGLATDEGIPLVRFAHAAVRTLVHEPGWTPPQPERGKYDEIHTSGGGYIQRGVHRRGVLRGVLTASGAPLRRPRSLEILGGAEDRRNLWQRTSGRWHRSTRRTCDQCSSWTWPGRSCSPMTGRTAP